MIFVLDQNKRPLEPYHPAAGRKLLKEGKAVVHKMYPFTIRLKEKISDPLVKEYHLKIDPGSKQTGLGITDSKGNVVFIATLSHRADMITKNITQRSQLRRSRRGRKTRYRQSRFLNRTRAKGWLPPSIQSTVNNIQNWTVKLSKLCPINKIFVETVRFDTQLMDNPNISGIEYQQGTLWGYEVKEYILYKYGHECQYCKGESSDPILEVEHKHPKSRGGSNAIKNLTLSCRPCNQAKNSFTPIEWLEVLQNKKSKTTLDKERIKNLLKVAVTPRGNRDAARVNSSRKSVYRTLGTLTQDLTVSSGGTTKFNRESLKLPKTHYHDALCVKEVPGAFIFHKGLKELVILASGRGTRSRTLLDKYGFPRAYLPRKKNFFGFQSGDMVKAIVTKGKKKGIYTGTVGCRSAGYFNIKTSDKTIQGINFTNCKVIQRSDGYNYNLRKVVEV